MVCVMCLQTAPGKSRKAMCKLLFSSPRQTDNKEGEEGSVWAHDLRISSPARWGASASRHGHKAGVVEEAEKGISTLS